MTETIHRPGRSAMRQMALDLADALQFFSRLPAGWFPVGTDETRRPSGFSAVVRVLPVAGLLIGIVPALVLVAALRLDLDSFLAAILAIGTLTAVTGGLHEDGLADTADSLGASTRERRLSIMRDSHIGAYGTTALILAFALRIGAVAALSDRIGAAAAFAAVTIVASLSRTACVTPLAFLPHARSDGASHAVGRPSREAFWFAAALAGGLAVLFGALAGIPLRGAAAMIVCASLAALVMTWFSARHIGGQTGDIAGATQLLAEIAALLGLLIALGR
jgi:adenosylcobinamide-GDP ribazoletransferase